MHEFAIVHSLLDVAAQHARQAGAVRVTRLHCRVGELCQVNDQVMVEAFELLREGTICQDAELHIEKTYMRAECRQCQRRFDVRNWEWHCPECGGEGRTLGGGDELELTSLEAEAQE